MIKSCDKCYEADMVTYPNILIKISWPRIFLRTVQISFCTGSLILKLKLLVSPGKVKKVPKFQFFVTLSVPKRLRCKKELTLWYTEGAKFLDLPRTVM